MSEARTISSVLPVPDLDAAVSFWKNALGVEPTFVDGDRWAQFDLEGRRLALAGTDAVASVPGVMVKVDDVRATKASLEAVGVEVREIVEGPHELRCVVPGPGGWPAILYASKA
jgi:catechol 2,3-dioxygenase-like lactoylglutathione lyase family enzyme